MNNEIIEKIKNDNKELLKISKKEMKNNGISFKDSVKRIINEMKNCTNDSNNEELLNSIYSISEEIEEADSIEKIVELRKKLNYLITKIKKEKEKRNLILASSFDFLEETNKYRKSIAKHIRYLKRINNIKEIEKLNSNYTKLSLEELENLKKIVKREQNYNRKNLPQKEVIKVIPKKEDKKIDMSFITDLKVNTNKTIKVLAPVNEDTLEQNIDQLRDKYKMNQILTYEKSIGANMITLVKNIPVYLRNKKIISSIEEENVDEKAFDGFIEFNARRNSIKLALKGILNPKYRNSIENLYLSNDYYCSYWIKKCYSLSLHR